MLEDEFVKEFGVIEEKSDLVYIIGGVSVVLLVGVGYLIFTRFLSKGKKGGQE